jgi:hypothetical protein
VTACATVARRTVAFCVILVTGAGCWAEGNSYFLGTGETERFLTMARCEREATASFRDGNPKYSGYECRARLPGFTTEKRDYQSGKLQTLIK